MAAPALELAAASPPVVPEAGAARAIEILAGAGHRAVTIGEVTAGNGTVRIA